MRVSPRPQRQLLVPPGGIEHHVRDMTASFSADVTLAAAQAELARDNQWLPIDGDPAATLGELVQTNSTGPLRLGYGAWRDLLLGCQFTNGHGELITAGGRTVKNVAGYDLTKFMVGQYGIFGRVVTLTARTYRRPGASLRARFNYSAASVARLMTTSCRPQWALMHRGQLHCGYLGDESALSYYQSALSSHGAIEVTRHNLEEDIEYRSARWLSARPPVRFRASVPPEQVIRMLQEVEDESCSADPAFGIVVGSCATDGEADRIEQLARELGGSVVLDEPRRLRQMFDDSAPTGRLLRRLLDAFAGQLPAEVDQPA